MDTVVTEDLAYATTGRPLLWDTFRPAEAADDAPVILVFHGGGWRAGSRKAVAGACQAFARRGFIAVAPEYRLVGEAAWPAALEDVQASIAAASSAAGLAGRPIFLAGFSAGAHLALLAAAGAPQKVHGVAAYFPIARVDDRWAEVLQLRTPEEVAAVTPGNHAIQLPPTIIFCGDEDQITPAETSLDLYRAIRAANGVADLRLFAKLIHEFGALPGMLDATVDDALAFFRRTSLEKDAFDTALEGLHRWWADLLKKSG
jgi:acetyl esterase/lipase